jgi:hypothetical protein
VAGFVLGKGEREVPFHEEEVRVILWPINIEELAREIEGALHTTQVIGAGKTG